MATELITVSRPILISQSSPLFHRMTIGTPASKRVDEDTAPDGGAGSIVVRRQSCSGHRNWPQRTKARIYFPTTSARLRTFKSHVIPRVSWVVGITPKRLCVGPAEGGPGGV